MRRKVYSQIGAACAMALLASTNTNAASCFGDPTGYCLSDGNATFSVDSNGLMEMTTGIGTATPITHIYTTDFLVDNRDLIVEKGGNKGDSLPAFSFFDYMDLTQDPGTDPSALALNDLGTDFSWGSIDLGFQLTGGTVGTEDAATISETFTITNTSGADLVLSMVAYTDVDLGGSLQGNALDDQGALQSFQGTQPDSFLQWDGKYEMLATVDIAVDQYEVGLGTECDPNFPDLCYKVYNDLDAMLTDTVESGPGDLQMAAQWLRTLADGESFTYTQTMTVGLLGSTEVPVPAAAWLFGSGLLGLVGIARRRKV